MTDGARDRAILHVDMDAFFVSVELLSRPDLAGRQVIVGHAGERSVVLSASYPCRALGVRSAMPMSTAIRMAPRAVVLEPNMAAYRRYSERIMAIFREVTPLVEQVSVDEAFLDVTGSLLRLGTPEAIGAMLRLRIRDELGLPASVGIARNKFVAKVASTRAKPDGLLAVPPARTAGFLQSLPVRSLWGVGERTARVLAGAGITTVADLAQVPPRTLERMLGAQGPHLHALAWGLDDRPVEPVRVEKSIGAEETFARDVSDAAAIRRELLRLSHRVAERLRASGREAGTVVLKVRYADFTTITRSRRLAQPAGAAPAVHQAAEALFEALGTLPQPVRLLGVRAEQLVEAGGYQLSIDRSEGNWRQAEEAMDRIRARFPQGAVRPATLLPARTSADPTADLAAGQPGNPPAERPADGPAAGPAEGGR